MVENIAQIRPFETESNPHVSVGPSVLDQVVSNKLCVGCGMCAGMLPHSLRMINDKYGTYRPELVDAGATPQWREISLRVCPFADQDQNEDAVAAKLYGSQPGIKYLTGVGYHLATHTGHIADNYLRTAATSGGIATWFLKSLMEDGTVDAAVCVGRSTVGEPLFDYQIIDDPRDLDRCKKSRYYPVELSKVISCIRESRKRVVLVGLPCFIKAVRLATVIDPILRECVAYTVSIFCGHLKSRAFAAYLARCCGVRDEEIVTVDFRKAVPSRNASDYDFEVTYRRGREEERKSVRVKEVFGANWSLNLFMLNACNYCDDLIGETADVSIGDAWIEPYSRDYRGTNLLVSRRQEVVDRLQRGCESGDLRLEAMPAEVVLTSQAGSFRQRRSGLSYRLYLNQRAGAWYPTKRVEPTARNLPLFNRMIQRIRLRIAKKSHEAFLRFGRADTTTPFVRALTPWVVIHDLLYAARQWRSLPWWLAGKLPQPIRRTLRKLVEVIRRADAKP